MMLYYYKMGDTEKQIKDAIINMATLLHILTFQTPIFWHKK
jgi:hypothetical protein